MRSRTVSSSFSALVRHAVASLSVALTVAGCSGATPEDQASSEDDALTQELSSAVRSPVSPDDVLPDAEVLPDEVPAGIQLSAGTSADAAIAWYANAAKKTPYKYEGLCETAAEVSYGRKFGRYMTATADYNGHRSKIHTDLHPPKGALVFWHTSANGHVGVADGQGGFWASSVGGKIGHAKLPYYSKPYLGWALP